MNHSVMMKTFPFNGSAETLPDKENYKIEQTSNEGTNVTEHTKTNVRSYNKKKAERLMR
ncbi:MAG: hypothetical protein HUJ83_05890 [Veillonella sp.]|nr:hypothetical protein [Veillonella sp.]